MDGVAADNVRGNRAADNRANAIFNFLMVESPSGITRRDARRLVDW